MWVLDVSVAALTETVENKYHCEDQQLRMESYNFESVREFTYLGVSINDEN
jgi:hypothetical protein